MIRLFKLNEINKKTNKEMTDIFDNIILCSKCNSKMQKAQIAKNGFVLRAVVCPHCGSKIVHPNDEAEYGKFVDLKNKEFMVKMRLVGNSYAVSIPKEIVSFIREQEKIMDDMVKLCFENFGKLSLNFGQAQASEDDEQEKEVHGINGIKITEIKKKK